MNLKEIERQEAGGKAGMSNRQQKIHPFTRWNECKQLRYADVDSPEFLAVLRIDLGVERDPLAFIQ